MGCCASVKQALTSLPGVTNVETDAGTTTAVVSVDPEKFDAAAAVAALDKAHYPATKAEDISPTAKPEETVENPAEGEPTEAAEKPEGEEPETTEEEATEKPEVTEEPAESTEKPAEAKEETEVIE